MTKEELYKKIDNDNSYAIGCLLLLYGFQTPDEQELNGTVYDLSLIHISEPTRQPATSSMTSSA